MRGARPVPRRWRGVRSPPPARDSRPLFRDHVAHERARLDRTRGGDGTTAGTGEDDVGELDAHTARVVDADEGSAALGDPGGCRDVAGREFVEEDAAIIREDGVEVGGRFSGGDDVELQTATSREVIEMVCRFSAGRGGSPPSAPRTISPDSIAR